MSLVELIVVIVVSGLLLALVSMVFINGWTSQQRTAERDKATGGANVVTSIVASVRNATVVRVDGTGTRLDAAVITTTGSWDCRAWTINGGNLYYKATGTTPLPADAATGTPIVVGVSGLLGSNAGFALDGAKAVRIGLGFTVGKETVKIRDGVTAQALETGAPTCW